MFFSSFFSFLLSLSRQIFHVFARVKAFKKNHPTRKTSTKRGWKSKQNNNPNDKQLNFLWLLIISIRTWRRDFFSLLLLLCSSDFPFVQFHSVVVAVAPPSIVAGVKLAVVACHSHGIFKTGWFRMRRTSNCSHAKERTKWIIGLISFPKPCLI